MWGYQMNEQNEAGPKYSNMVNIMGGPFDIYLEFGLKLPTHDISDQEFDSVAKIHMSHSHAKTMLPILARVIADYEQQFGTIPAPGFNEKSKE